MSTLVNFMKCQDYRVLYLFNRSMKCRPLDILMYMVTQLGSLSVVVSLVLICLFSSSPTIVSVGHSLAIVLMFSQVIVHFLKLLTNRPRPFTAMDNIIGRRISAPGFSFPSGHSCAALAVAITLGSFVPVAAALLISLAILVGISRIYLGAHYPSDVLVGFLIAFIVYGVCI
ncbi:MAG: phosphatase PAP2 family protein [Firmicutes bacterium HGW-Firmicutes-15]|nr:MAG: phosphatase PAP2 family protein [Firmicutes bacterium HGW-Firmicutes-15]